MKNNNENSKENNDAASVHEELCAFVLGELNEEQAQAMEARLADDSELRAERERLEATIGLVTDFCSEGESLSPMVMEALEHAAAPTPIVQMVPRAWYQAAPVRAAAGFVALASGVVAGLTMMDPNPGPVEGEPTFESLAMLQKSELGAPPWSPNSERIPRDEESQVNDRLGAPIPQVNNATADREVELENEISDTRAALSATERKSSSRKSGKSSSELGTELASSERTSPHVKSRENLEDLLKSTPGIDFESSRAKLQSTAIFQSELARENELSAGSQNRPALDSATLVAGLPVLFDGPFRGPGDAVPAIKPAQAPLGEARLSIPSESLRFEGTTTLTVAAELQALPSSLVVPGSVAVPKSVRRVSGVDLSGFGQSTGSPSQLERLASMGYVGEPDLVVLELRTDLSHLDGGIGELGRRGFGHSALTPQEQTERILQDCRRISNETPRAMFFRFWGDNSFELAKLDRLSTFSADVDTASYALARRYLKDGNLPGKPQIRTEEFVNYFKADLPAPSEGTFSIHTELSPSRYGQSDHVEGQRWMMRVGVRGKDVAREERKALALTFVVDTSGSMKEGERMKLVKHALRLLLTQLDAADSIAIVGFNTSASVVLPMTSVQNREMIETAIFGLRPDGGTNAEGGLKLGYEVAAAALTSQAHNRVVLLSDGVANIGQVDQDRINNDVKQRRESGIFLNTIGVGMNNHNDNFLEQLANKGDGLCNYVDSPGEARRALVENFTGAFETIARDVKIQVEFDAIQVYRYRLLGYENRAIADADFRNDAVDAGEVGAGHQVVALYELEFTGVQSTEPLAKVNLRWKAPSGAGRDPLEDQATEISSTIALGASQAWSGTTTGYRRSVIVAQFAEILRRSVHARGDSLDSLIADARVLSVQDTDEDFIEFVGLLERSRQLILDNVPRNTDLTDCIDALRRNRLLWAQVEDLRSAENEAVLKQLEANNRELESQVRSLIEGQLEKK